MADDWTTTINTGVPNPARIYDYLLGGKDNFPADRQVAEQLLAIAPVARDVVEDNRAFLRRAVRVLTREAGIRQFIDLGSGLPTQGNVHEIAQAIAPDARVVYVDNDAMVVTHSRALLAGNNTVAIQADLREPDRILGHPEVRELIDFHQPIALLLMAILHFIPDDEDPLGIVARFRDALPTGSYLAISHGTQRYPGTTRHVSGGDGRDGSEGRAALSADHRFSCHPHPRAGRALLGRTRPAGPWSGRDPAVEARRPGFDIAGWVLWWSRPQALRCCASG